MTPAPTAMLIASRGVVTTLASARGRIAFTPQVPKRFLAVALIPPLDVHRGSHAAGIAFEYRTGRIRVMLSEWPRFGLSLTDAGPMAPERPCALIAYAPRAFVWTTASGVVMTLQPDGRAAAAAVAREAHRLIRRERCR